MPGTLSENGFPLLTIGRDRGIRFLPPLPPLIPHKWRMQGINMPGTLLENGFPLLTIGKRQWHQILATPPHCDYP